MKKYKSIQITQELRDYIEMLQYEAFRYKDLLNIVNKELFHGTESEWNESYEYYREQSEIAEASLKFAKESITEMYKEEIGDSVWHINFDDCELRIGTCHSVSKKQKIGMETSYSEMISRFYPPKQKQDYKTHSVKNITFQVTNDCNMACTYCYQNHKSNNSMNFDTAKKFIDMLLARDEKTSSYLNLKETQGIIFDFIGGEPWLEVDLVSQISDYFIHEMFRRKDPWIIKYMFSICSNGLLHFDERVQNYIKKHKNHLSYSISIDGNKELHDSCRIDKNGCGTYDRAMAAVEDYRNKFHDSMGSKMTISPDNITKLSQAVIDMIQINKYTNINLNCVFEEGWTNKHALILYKELNKITDWLIENQLEDKITLSIFNQYHLGQKLPEENNKNWCGGTGYMLSIDYKGDLYPCQRYSPASIGDKQPEFTIGNLNQGIGIEKEHLDRIKCLNCITRRSQSTNECFNCPIASGCAWCSAYNYEIFGTPNKRATFICCMHKARVLANMYHWWKQNKKYEVDFPKNWAIEILGEDEYNKLLKLQKGE